METCKILITNQKGGVGKSTISANLAAYLHIQNNQSVCLIDYDRQSSSSQWVRKAPNIGIRVEQLRLPYEDSGRLVLTEAKIGLRKYSNGIDISISDLTWAHSIPMEFLLEFDLILVPSGTSKFEMASSEIFVLEYVQKYHTQISHKQQSIMMVPSRVNSQFDSSTAFLNSQNIDVCSVAPPIFFNSKLDQHTYEDFLCVSPDDEIAKNFIAFGLSVTKKIEAWKEFQDSYLASGPLAHLNNRKISVLDTYRMKRQQEEAKTETLGRFIPAFLRKKNSLE